MATCAPARGDSFPLATVTAVIGPGAITPEREMATVSAKNANMTQTP